MPQPTSADLHVDTFLTNLAVAWAQDQRVFVADKVFPTVSVQKQSDLYAIYQKGYFYRDEMRVRPLGGRPQQAGYGVTNGTYRCVEYALEHKVDDRVRANADQPLDPDRAAMRLLTGQAMIRRDRDWASKYFTTGVWGTDLTGVASAPSTNQFLQFDQSGSDPIGLVQKKVDDLLSATGYAGNKLVIGRDAWRVIRNHADVKDRIKYTQRGIVTEDVFASLVGVDEVIVPGSVYNSSHEGQSDSIDFIVGRKAMLLVYAAAAPSVEEPSAGYTFAWTGLVPGANSLGGVIERGREELAHSDVFQCRQAFDTEIVASELGAYFSAAVA
jgi:hypothetical protein